MHYTPYNLVRFYVGEITGTTPQTVKIYTDLNTSTSVTVSEGNKWYTYVLPKDKGLCKIESGICDYEDQTWYNGIVKKVVVKANINYNYDENNDRFNGIVPWEITEASFKGSDTSKVTNMNSMLANCNGLTSLTLSNFDTSNVTNMACMFYGCNGLTSLDLSNFNTSNVTLMNGMFQKCSKLTSLDISNFNTSNVTDMRYIFYGCSGLESLTLSGWVINDATSVIDMFYDCDSLKTIRMVGCSEDTIGKINSVKPSSATIVTE